MQESLVFDNTELHTIRHAAKHVSYSKDYITKLAREKKIAARWIGRQWYVDVTSLEAYANSAKLEQQLRKQRLSEERKQEHELRTRSQERAARHSTVTESGALRATAATATVLLLGVSLGSAFYTALGLFEQSAAVGSQTAAVIDAPLEAVSDYVPELSVVPQVVIASASSTLSTTTAIVLLPNGASMSDPTELFSDPLQTHVDETGATILMARDHETGQVSELQYVSVPVVEGDTVTDHHTTYE